MRRAWSRYGGGGGGWRAVAAWCCAAGAALWLVAGPGRQEARAELATRRDFPHHSAAALAHLLADFTALPHATHAVPGSWRVEEDVGNYSAWRYRVTWSCGARCSGSARVHAHAPPPTEPQRHRVLLHISTCEEAAPGLLSLLCSPTCDEMEISAEVFPSGGGGAVLRETATARCGAAGAAGCHAALRRHRAEHLARGLRPSLDAGFRAT